MPSLSDAKILLSCAALLLILVFGAQNLPNVILISYRKGTRYSLSIH